MPDDGRVDAVDPQTEQQAEDELPIDEWIALQVRRAPLVDSETAWRIVRLLS
jgi:hypothetical protein